MSPQKRTNALVGAAATFLVSFFAFGVFGVVFVTHEIDQSQKRLCGVINVGIQPLPTPPIIQPSASPTSPAGKALVEYNKSQAAQKAKGQREMKKLSEDYNCPKGDQP